MRALLLLVAACGATSRPAEVRLAHEGELSGPRARYLRPEVNEYCALEGAQAPELRAPVLAFARANLLADLDHMTGWSSVDMGIETPAERVGCNHPDHRDGYFTEITVDSRSKVGMLRIAQRQLVDGSCAWGASIVYCLHVIETGHGTTIAVEQVGGMLGSSEPAARPPVSAARL